MNDPQKDFPDKTPIDQSDKLFDNTNESDELCTTEIEGNVCKHRLKNYPEEKATNFWNDPGCAESLSSNSDDCENDRSTAEDQPHVYTTKGYRKAGPSSKAISNKDLGIATGKRQGYNRNPGLHIRR